MQYRFMLTLFVAVLVSLISFTVVQAQDEAMTNEEVISLAKAGLSPSIIVGKIRSGKTNFDLSTDSLIKLKQAGVSDDIVSAMLEAKSGRSTISDSPTMAGGGDPNDPMSKHSYGIYLSHVLFVEVIRVGSMRFAIAPSPRWDVLSFVLSFSGAILFTLAIAQTKRLAWLCG